MRDLARLLVMEEVAGNDGWYLTEGLLDIVEVRSTPDVMDELCRRLSPRLEELVAVLDVPLEVLRAPIATDDYVAAFMPRSA